MSVRPAPRIKQHDAELAREFFELIAEHAGVQRQPVDKHQRLRAFAVRFVIDFDIAYALPWHRRNLARLGPVRQARYGRASRRKGK